MPNGETRVQFLRFALAGVIGFVVDSAILSLLLRAGVQPYLARLGSFTCAATVTWLLNRRYTFRSRGGALGEWRRFVLANAGGGLINYAVYALIVHRFGTDGLVPVFGVAAGSLSGLLINFTLSKMLVFRATAS